MPEAGLSRAILGFAGVRSVGLLCSVSRDLGLEATKVKKVVDCLAAGAQVRPTLGWQCGQAGGTGQVFICGGYDGARPFAGRRKSVSARLLPDVHRFDPATNSWGTVPPLPIPREAREANGHRHQARPP